MIRPANSSQNEDPFLPNRLISLYFHSSLGVTASRDPFKGKPSDGENSALCKYSEMLVLGPLFGAVTWLYHGIFLQPLIRFFFSIAFWNRLTSGFHLWGRKIESDN